MVKSAFIQRVTNENVNSGASSANAKRSDLRTCTANRECSRGLAAAPINKKSPVSGGDTGL